jgi:diacylglycerol kinase (ATP)
MGHKRQGVGAGVFARTGIDRILSRQSQTPRLAIPMRKAKLLYNPLSGHRRGRRLADVEAGLSVLRSAGVEASAAPTRAASDAAEQTRQAIAEGCDTVFACGGDGTVHDVLQGLVGTQAALAVIPLGTANSLAHDLRLPLSPAGAAQAALAAKPRRIAVGRIEFQDFTGKRGSRYFTVTVGIGMDAHLFYSLNPFAKQRLGMPAYYAKATRLWLTHKMENFAVAVSEDGQSRRAEVSQILAVRIRDFGGVLRELAPGASLDRDDLRMVLFHTHSRLAYLRYILRGLFGADWKVPGIELVHSTGAICRDGASSTVSGTKSRIFVEADGELLGTLPADVSMVRDAVTLLAPD